MPDLTKLNMVLPAFPTDKIIGIFTGTLNVAAPTSVQGDVYAEQSKTTGFKDTCLTQCIYSLDGGTTWLDGDMSKPNLTGSSPVFQTTDVTCFSDINTVGIACTNWYNFVAGSGTAVTVLYKIFCLAKTNQGVIQPLTTNYALNYTSTDNYLKIFTQGRTQLSIPGSGTPFVFNVGHTLGYIPTVRGYVEYTNGRIWPASPNQYPNTGGLTNNNPILTSIQITTSNAGYHFVSADAGTDIINLHYAIYYNA